MHQLHKDENEKNLTTADIATDRSARGPQLVNQERDTNDIQPDNVHGSSINRDARDEVRAALFPDNEVNDMRSRWDKIQTGFVDEPRQAVKQADELVASAIKRIAEQFAQERTQLEQQWDRGDNVSTEDLRQALRRYRAFFDRLLSV
jgi:hypothetical protein